MNRWCVSTWYTGIQRGLRNAKVLHEKFQIGEESTLRRSKVKNDPLCPTPLLSYLKSAEHMRVKCDFLQHFLLLRQCFVPQIVYRDNQWRIQGGRPWRTTPLRTKFSVISQGYSQNFKIYRIGASV